MEAQISLLCRGSVRLRRESSVANGGIELRADGVPDEEVDDVNDDPVSPSWSSAGFSSEITKLIAIYYALLMHGASFCCESSLNEVQNVKNQAAECINLVAAQAANMMACHFAKVPTQMIAWFDTARTQGPLFCIPL